MRAAILALALLAGGCGASARQVTLSAQAEVLVSTQSGRERFYLTEHARCLEREDLGAYRRCMAPSRGLARSMDTYDRLLRAAQAALRASEQGVFEAMIPDLIRVASEVVRGLGAAGVPVPESVRQIAELLHE